MADARSAEENGVAIEITDIVEGVARVAIRLRLGTSIPFRLATLRALDGVLAELERLAAVGEARIVLLATDDPPPTLAGYDLDEIRLLREEDVIVWSHEAQTILRRLEELPIPSVAAIRGEWSGAAVELALACSYRVAADTPDTVLVLPQVSLGFIPAWGGTVRLPRLVGLQAALDLVLGGQPVGMKEAREMRLVDRVVPADDFADRVIAYARRRLEFGRPRRRRRVQVGRRLLDDTAPGRRLLASRASRRYAGSPGGTAAAEIAVGLVVETVTLPLDKAFAQESAAAGRLILSSDVQGRIHAQRLTGRAALRLPAGAADLEGAGVLGSGDTASDLAHLLATAGVPVRVRSERREAARLAVARAHERVRWEVEIGRTSEAQAAARIGRIEATNGFGGFGTFDLVAAAADPGAGGVESLLLEAEPHVRDACVLAFTDWTASPTHVQRALRVPERALALLPGLPFDRFPLLEIAPGSLTSPATVGLIRRLARRLDATAVVVSDQTPTPGIRLLSTYFVEASRLLAEGATVAQVDAAAEDFGFAVGPFHRADAIGSPRTARMLEDVAQVLGERMAPAPAFTAVGARAGTFYRYRNGRPSGPSRDLPAGVSPGGPAVATLIRKRLLYALINEAARILEEECVTDPGDVDLISIVQLGFPRERGGILFHAEEIGLHEVVGELTREAARAGERYRPAGLLHDLAATGRGFFARGRKTLSGQGEGPML